MDRDRLSAIDLEQIPSPCFIVDEQALAKNLAILDAVQAQAGCKILLALKGFAMFTVFPQISAHLQGVCASSAYEARLGREAFGGEVHTYAPAYSDVDFDDIVRASDCIIFNSIAQWKRYRPRLPARIPCGLRINPEASAAPADLYNPCARYSRLGIPACHLPEDLNGITGLHFHALCEQNADALTWVLEAVEKKFGRWLPRVKWMNFGGGHHITRPDYDVDRLVRLIKDFSEKHGVDVILEPGEAVVLNCGVLITTVLDIVENEKAIAILDTSVEAHINDVLAMPFRPSIVGAGKPGEFGHDYRLGGLTCLAGDVLGDYSFSEPLRPGQKLILEDMAHYTMVKTTLFNGIRLPAIALLKAEGRVDILRQSRYQDYKERLS